MLVSYRRAYLTIFQRGHPFFIDDMLNSIVGDEVHVFSVQCKVDDVLHLYGMVKEGFRPKNNSLGL